MSPSTPSSRRPPGPPSRPASWALACAGFAAAAPSAAHGLDANRLQLVAHESVVEVVATPPADFFPAADTDLDGRLTVAEVRARRDDLLAALVAAVVVTDADGRPGALDRADVSVPRDDDARGSDHVRLTVVLRWPAPPRALRVRCAFVTQHPVTVFATRAESLSAPGVLTLLGDGEYATLATPAAEATVLRVAPSPAPPPRAAPRAPAPRPTGLLAVAALATLAAAALVGALARRRQPPERPRRPSPTAPSEPLP